MYDLVTLAQKDRPTILVCTEPFEELARGQGVVLGGMVVPLAVIPHPLASLTELEVAHCAEFAARQVLEELWTR